MQNKFRLVLLLFLVSANSFGMEIDFGRGLDDENGDLIIKHNAVALDWSDDGKYLAVGGQCEDVFKNGYKLLEDGSYEQYGTGEVCIYDSNGKKIRNWACGFNVTSLSFVPGTNLLEVMTHDDKSTTIYTMQGESDRPSIFKGYPSAVAWWSSAFAARAIGEIAVVSQWRYFSSEWQNYWLREQNKQIRINILL